MTRFIKSLLILTTACLFTLGAHAQSIETKAKQAILVDYESGERLFEKNADMPMVPSSMTKLMTVYIVFDHLKKGVLSLDSTFNVSEAAWRKGGSRMFLEPNTSVTVGDLLKGIIVQSGNDACIVVAEGISGSEDAFAELMNQTAKDIGLTNSRFLNATGWPDDAHYMSASDIAILSQRLITDFPEYYPHFAIKEFTFNNIKQGNRNILLANDNGIDGLKTGHTEDGGYGVVISGVGEDGRRQIVVVNGLDSARERASEARSLYDYGQRYFGKITKYKPGQIIGNTLVKFGKKETVGLTTETDIIYLAPKLKLDRISEKIAYDNNLEAPISKGDRVASLVVEIPGLGKKIYPLIASEDIEDINWAARYYRTLKEKAGM